MSPTDSHRDNMYNLTKGKNLYFDCKTFLDFDEKYSFLYPLTSDEKFNAWIQTNVVEKYMANPSSCF